MPAVLIVVAVLVGTLIFMVLMLPLSIAMRFRAASTKRRAWGWVVSLNLFATALSAAVLLTTAAVSSAWIPHAFRSALIGLLSGFLLGFVGLALSRWETTQRGLHYTPNRWLILMITLLVAARIVYGLWRGWHAWSTTPGDESWLAASGAAGSMGAGAVVLGYYIIYWAGVRRRARAHRRALAHRARP